LRLLRRTLALLLAPLLVVAHTLPAFIDLVLPEGEHHCACPLDDHHCTCPVCAGDDSLADADWSRKTFVPEPCGLLPVAHALLARVPALVDPPTDVPSAASVPLARARVDDDGPPRSRAPEPPVPPPKV